MKQETGHIIVNGKPVLVLIRQLKWGRSLKLRQSGQLGVHLEDEERYLTSYLGRKRLSHLLSGKTIRV